MSYTVTIKVEPVRTPDCGHFFGPASERGYRKGSERSFHYKRDAEVAVKAVREAGGDAFIIKRNF